MDYKLSQHAQSVIVARGIKLEWVEVVCKMPTRKDVISVNEVHFYATIPSNENRCLKVVCNPITQIVVTAYFDRNMRKKGCK